jgi:(1->4)-alpha-D-glucan 1-alpha-D-glucosylmutase
LLGDLLNGTIADASRTTEIAQRWEQLTGAVMAKGVEDTATYRYPGLLSHAEVGSDPDTAARSMDDFWAFSDQRGRQFPSGLNATSTHDSKRSEDTRAQLYALSEAADDWGALLHTWRQRHAKGNACVPSPFDELFIYQTLAAIWPNGQINLPTGDWERVAEYVVKAAREAKCHTTWVDPDAAYEDLLRTFVADLEKPPALEFRTELRDFVRSVAPSSATNGLAMVVLKSVCPGVPDFYQGTEMWTRTLTDPDNRRPIDFDAHQATLDRLSDYRPSMDGWEDGRVKLWVTRALMRLRRAQPRLFSDGSYDRLEVVGPLQDHLIAIGRRHGNNWLIAMVPRLMWSHLAVDQFPIGAAVWADTRLNLPDGLPQEMTDVLTGQSLDLKSTDCGIADVLSQLPVAVLYGASAH